MYFEEIKAIEQQVTKLKEMELERTIYFNVQGQLDLLIAESLIKFKALSIDEEEAFAILQPFYAMMVEHMQYFENISEEMIEKSKSLKDIRGLLDAESDDTEEAPASQQENSQGMSLVKL